MAGAWCALLSSAHGTRTSVLAQQHLNLRSCLTCGLQGLLAHRAVVVVVVVGLVFFQPYLGWVPHSVSDRGWAHVLSRSAPN